MNQRRDRWVNQELLIDIHVHISDRPVDLLGLNTRDLLPFVGILSIEQHNLGLGGTVVHISFLGESTTVDSWVRNSMGLVQRVWDQILEYVCWLLLKICRGRHNQLLFPIFEQSPGKLLFLGLLYFRTVFKVHFQLLQFVVLSSFSLHQSLFDCGLF